MYVLYVLDGLEHEVRIQRTYRYVLDGLEHEVRVQRTSTDASKRYMYECIHVLNVLEDNIQNSSASSVKYKYSSLD